MSDAEFCELQQPGNGTREDASESDMSCEGLQPVLTRDDDAEFSQHAAE